MMPEARPYLLRRLRSLILGSLVLRAAAPVTIIAVILLLSIPCAHSSTPVIYLIELFSTNQVLVHFDTDATRTYTLQYTDKRGTNGFAGSTWSNLYNAPLLPFPNHYIVVDTRTNKMRFYRLSVTT